MNKKYNLKLDLQFRCNNSIMKFNQFDNNTSDFFMRITNGGKLIDIEKAIVVLAVIKPSGKVSSQFIEAETVEQNLQVALLEGDHTQNPPSYFEGLKSVGQSATTSEDGADEIVVSSVKGDGNLRSIDNVYYGDVNTATGKLNPEAPGVVTSKQLIPVNSTNIYAIGYDKDETLRLTSFFCYDKFKQYLGIAYNNKLLTNTFFIRPRFVKTDFSPIDKASVSVSLSKTEEGLSTPYQSDKKRLLYYNTETQTWEKPILREWDSIEKHTNGKYYYHQRSGEVVLNGSENWLKTSSQPTSGNHSRFIITNFPKDVVQALTVVICDKYNNQKLFNDSSVGIYVDKNINITVDGVVEVEEFKNNLNTNPVTVVYQLAQEKVYECTNIDLITYANETNYVVNSGAISPKSTLKVHNNISNVVSLLQKKVSLLESNVKASQEVQDMMILETDMRMLDIELALMEFVPITLNLGGSDVLRSATYFNFLKNHIVNETYEKEYLENVMNKYLATGRINQDEYDELYKMLYPPVYDIELPIEY